MLARKIIRDGESLRGFLDDVIKETFQGRKIVLSEDNDKKALSSGDISLEDVVEKLNVIRSGRSLKDEEVLAAMQKYLDDLETAEKTALFSFLKGISQVMTAGVEGDKAFEPSESPAKVKMDKKPSQQKVSIKPTVIKKPTSKSPEKKTSEEDTTPPLPIEPKKK